MDGPRPTSKLVDFNALLTWRTLARTAGRTVVHCHGCFDIVHPGHIAHLQEARALGDCLVVTVSSDVNVNKGAARPLIPDDLRAGSLAALECVDVVYVNHHPTAAELLADLKPDIYVKGKEYERSSDPRLAAEVAAVRAAGGRVVFTSGDIVYSSTALIARLTATDPFETEKLARFRTRYSLGNTELSRLVRGFDGRRVVVVGDYIQDRYHFCDATGVASEGPMMSLRLLSRRDYDGGAAVIARHAAAMGACPTLVTALADDAESAAVRERMHTAGVEVTGLSDRRQLVTKHRYLCETTKVLKIDDGAISPVDLASAERLAETIISAADGADAVIFADFGYGLLTQAVIDAVLPRVRLACKVISADISGRQASLRHFRDVDLLTPTERELRDAVNEPSAGLPAAAWNLLQVTNARGLLVTLGRQGAIAFDHPADQPRTARLRSEHVPALATHAVDPLGCGDAMLTTATLTLAAGGSLQAGMLLGSLAAAVAAQRLGNDAVSAEDLLDAADRLWTDDVAGMRLAG
jgi:rfaE bifunctional protein kinase chain/domain/rfaE bifunctional protein nucleotidyltransferase chain/domain